MSEKQRYPLSWPEGWKRTTSRVDANFGKVKTSFDSGSGKFRYAGKSRLSIEDSFDRLDSELEALGADVHTVIVSTNVKTNLRGIPMGNQRDPSDSGAAVYWSRKGKNECMAIDRYFRVADNLAAIAATLNAMRAIERHGGAQIMERTFAGFAQLPESTRKNWREVLQLHAQTVITREMITNAYRLLAMKRHSDKGGSDESMIELNLARDAAFREIS